MSTRKTFVYLAVAGLFLSLYGESEMLGPLTREVILQDHPDWQEVVAAYQPDPQALDQLRTLDRPVRVEIFLGTWCPDSKAHVSEFFKVLDMANNPLITAAYFGLPRDKAKRAEYLQGRDIQKIPTFFIFLDGNEKGQILETPTKSMEQDLADILLR